MGDFDYQGNNRGSTDGSHEYRQYYQSVRGGATSDGGSENHRYHHNNRNNFRDSGGSASGSGSSARDSRGSINTSISSPTSGGNELGGDLGRGRGRAGGSAGGSADGGGGTNRARSGINNFTTEDAVGEEANNFGNDYNDHYLRSGVLPQSHIMNIEDPLIGYPKLQHLHTLKENHNRRFACKPSGCRITPREMPNRLNSWSTHGTNFDVVMVNGCIDNVPSYETLISLPIHKITPRPSVLFLWVPSPALEKGRMALEHWGFRRSEDIVYFVDNKSSVHFPKWLAVSPDDCLVTTTWHCLMGLKGTLRRSEDSDLINCNINTDVILETITDRSNVVPEQMYQIIENFSLMSRRLHIIPGYSTLNKPVRVRPGWVIMSPDVLLNNFDPLSYMAHNKALGYRVPVDDEIENLRPKTPPRVRKK